MWDIDDHMSVSDLQRINEAHPMISDVGDGQQVFFIEWSCEKTITQIQKDAKYIQQVKLVSYRKMNHSLPNPK